jgi:hypothetical protein
MTWLLRIAATVAALGVAFVLAGFAWYSCLATPRS